MKLLKVLLFLGAGLFVNLSYIEPIYFFHSEDDRIHNFFSKLQEGLIYTVQIKEFNKENIVYPFKRPKEIWVPIIRTTGYAQDGSAFYHCLFLKKSSQLDKSGMKFLKMTKKSTRCIDYKNIFSSHILNGVYDISVSYSKKKKYNRKEKHIATIVNELVLEFSTVKNKLNIKKIIFQNRIVKTINKSIKEFNLGDSYFENYLNKGYYILN